LLRLLSVTSPDRAEADDAASGVPSVDSMAKPDRDGEDARCAGPFNGVRCEPVRPPLRRIP